ncbi:MAG TPA: 8-amino-7-oxononanoate synthase [Thiolinea sp.]|nr:8-amino-7-oxononanoate synthase [Thiolinea sp.]
MDKYARLRHTLAQRQEQHLYRRPRITEGPQQPLLQVNGKSMLAFCSNNYLGLANHPEVIRAFQQAANQYGVGSGAAHLVNGHSRLHQQLEEALAEFTQRERVLLFSTGYMANLGLTTALAGRHDTIYQDRLNHASLLDAAQLAGAKLVRYPHNDTRQLAKRLDTQTSGQTLISTDGVFSMDGDTAPVKELAALARQHDAWLLVDDAHGFGVLGARGAGLLEAEQLGQENAVLMATLGKALGTAGAFVAGSTELIEYLIQTARPYIYTTAQPPALAAASLASLKLVQTETWRREHLQHLIQTFRQGAAQLGLALMPSTTAIQPILIGDNAKALAISQALEQAGILVTAIRPPTVPPQTARLRITFSAAHNQQQVEHLLDRLNDIVN